MALDGPPESAFSEPMTWDRWYLDWIHPRLYSVQPGNTPGWGKRWSLKMQKHIWTYIAIFSSLRWTARKFDPVLLSCHSWIGRQPLVSEKMLAEIQRQFPFCQWQDSDRSCILHSFQPVDLSFSNYNFSIFQLQSQSSWVLSHLANMPVLVGTLKDGPCPSYCSGPAGSKPARHSLWQLGLNVLTHSGFINVWPVFEHLKNR